MKKPSRQPYAHHQDEHELHELRCLHELARQLLPLREAEALARDGLLCIAGITGIGSGAIVWRAAADRPLHLLAHFGLRGTALPETVQLDGEAERYLQRSGAVTLESCRRRSNGRRLIESLGTLAQQFDDAWIVPLASGATLLGALCLGPSLVTREVVEEAVFLADLAETLCLALVGAGPGASAAPQAPFAVAAGVLDVRQRLAALRHRYPETQLFVGESAAVLGVLEEIVSLAATDYTVMLHGETGTGKELAAELLHRLSRRARGPFEAVDCSSIPRELIESELFGHVKGAFTGATRDFRGAFERADGGTLLLDEIGDMDLRSQARLLRVLQEGKVRPLGGDRAQAVSVRVVAASNKDVAAMVRAGTFREDLYYRVHVCPLNIPAVRERGDDCIVLFEHFMQAHAKELEREPRPLTSAARQRLKQESFPGNVRQLQNVVRRLLVQDRGRVEAEELERMLARAAAAAPLAAGRETSPRREAVTNVQDSVQDSVQDVGSWVLQQLRVHRFNLAATAKHLHERRRQGESRQAVPVFDRGALDYYLCGEFFERLVQRAFDLEAAVEDIAGTAGLAARVRRKVRAFVRPLAEAGGDCSAARAYFRRIPERYARSLEQVYGAVEEGRWVPQLP